MRLNALKSSIQAPLRYAGIARIITLSHYHGVALRDNAGNRNSNFLVNLYMSTPMIFSNA